MCFTTELYLPPPELVCFPFLLGEVISFFMQRMHSIRLLPKGFTMLPSVGLFSACLLCHLHFQTGTCRRQIQSDFFFPQIDEKLDLELALVIVYFKTGKDLSCRDRRTLVVLSHLPHSSFYTTQCSYMPRQPPHIPHAGCYHQLRSGQRGMNGSCVSLLDHAFKGPSPWSFPSSHWLVCRHGSRHHSSVFNHKWMLCVAHSTVTRQKKSVSLKP